MSFKGCRKCDKGYVINEESGEAVKCDCLIKHQQKIFLENLTANTNLPKLIDSYSFDNYVGPDNNNNIDKLKKYLEEFQDKFFEISLYIYGGNSTQKTTTVSFLGQELARRGFTVYYTTMNALIKDLCNESFKEEELEEILFTYYNCDLLILDECFDTSKVLLYKSGYQINFIDSFLRRRIEKEKKATIFISNVKMEDVAKDFGLSLKELITRNCKSSYLIFEDNINNVKNDFEVKDLWK